MTVGSNRSTIHVAGPSGVPAALTQEKGGFLLVCLLLIVHAPLVLNAGFYGDDWLIFEVKPGYQTMISFLLHGAGHPITYIYCALANLSGYPAIVLNLLALAGIAIGALNLRAFITRLRVLSEFETFLVIFFVWTYAGFRDWATKITAPYIISFALLCLGLNLFGIVASSRRPPVALRLTGLAAVFLSFAVNSMILIFLIGMTTSLWLIQREGGIRQTPKQYAGSLLRFWDYLAVPIIYWVSISYFFPKIGPYREYYRIRVPALEESILHLLQFARWGTYEPAFNGMHLALRAPWMACLSLVVATSLLALTMQGRRNGGVDVFKQIVAVMGTAMVSIVLFMVCALPYISVGIAPTGHFYESRHLLLFGLPLGLAVVCAVRIAGLLFGRVLAHAFGVVILSINLCSLWNGYFFQQARWVRQSAMIDQLGHDYVEPPAVVFNLDDGFLDYPGHTYFGITEITGSLHLIWDNRPLFGFTGRNEQPTVLREMASAMRMAGSPFRNMDLKGPQATIKLTPQKPVLAEYDLSLRYYLCLISSCQMREFLATVARTTIRVGKIDNLAPLDDDVDLGHLAPNATARGQSRVDGNRHD